MSEAPRVREGQKTVEGPVKVRSENLWVVEVDGERFSLAQLLTELSTDEALRRRYVRDAERRASLDVPGLARIVEVGPQPDPRDPGAESPWRLREQPSGEPFDRVLDERAPLPVDEALEIVAAIADVVHASHQAGMVLRDLEPRNILLTGGDPPVWLTDVGLARVDILSTRTASSLMLEGSPYAAPEHLRATVLDKRADIYTLGVILWHALTGAVPFADTIAFVRDVNKLATLESLGIDAPAGLDSLIAACLDDEPENRPESASDIALALRGGGGAAMVRVGKREYALARVVCQSCGAKMRPGLRLCLSCGREAIQFHHAEGSDERYEVLLMRAKEDADFIAKLRAFYEAVGEGPPPELNFVIGDARMYSKSERERLHKLPAVLISDVDEKTAERLAERLRGDGFRVKVQRVRLPGKKRKYGALLLAGAGGVVGGGVLLGTGALLAGCGALVAGGAFLVAGLIRRARNKRKPSKPLAGLRDAPAALPASDPLIAKLGELLRLELKSDVRDRVEEVALLVQRLVDHRAGHQSADLERVTEPVEPIVDLVVSQVIAIDQCDASLADLDEGTLVRAITRSEAKGEPRNVRVELYRGLDRLRELEDQRAQHMERLLEASSLMRRTVSLGLATKDQDVESDRLVGLALAALDQKS